MKISESWLRSWIDPAVDSETLADNLTSLGLEVDDLESARPAFDKVVVGRITTVAPHPDADRLRVCEVDAGESEAIQVVCGAPNARVGLATAFARVGGRLPDGTKLKKAKLRGVESFGMLCSASELGLAEEKGGIMELGDEAAAGMELAEWLNLDDTVIDIDLTPDRADCLSVRGLARDLSALHDMPLSERDFPPVEPAIADGRAVEVDPRSACARFTGRVVRGVNMGAPVPTEISERLRRAGIRSISPGVDATNYVMLEIGQPMHAFDNDKLQGTVRARLAKAGERLTLLDGREVALDDQTTVIADDSGALAIAGVMGGASTAIDENTTNVFFEAALFLPAELIGKPRRYGCHTESSHRFERGVDPERQREALEAATALLISISGGNAGPVTEVVVDDRLPKRTTVSLRSARLARVLGVPVPDEDVSRILDRLGIACDKTPDGWSVTPPSHRWDLAIEEDYIEEVGRVRGFDSLPRTQPTLQPDFRAAPESRVPELAIKRLLAHRGYQEVITYSFVDGARQARLRPDLEALELPNPISSELGVMRTTLVGGLIDSWQRNASRQLESVRLFETGLRFLPVLADAQLTPTHGDDIQIDDSVRQQNIIAGLIAGRRRAESWNSDAGEVDFYDLKADVEALFAQASGVAVTFVRAEHPMLHPGQAATVLIDDMPVGYIGAINPALRDPLDLPGQAYVFELSLAAVNQGRVPASAPMSRFPQVRRDLALLVDDAVTHDDILTSVRNTAVVSLRDVRVFDIYRGKGLPEGKKSVALSLILQDISRTLVDADVEKAVAVIVAALGQEHDARIRD